MAEASRVSLPDSPPMVSKDGTDGSSSKAVTSSLPAPVRIVIRPPGIIWKSTVSLDALLEIVEMPLALSESSPIVTWSSPAPNSKTRSAVIRLSRIGSRPEYLIGGLVSTVMVPEEVLSNR